MNPFTLIIRDVIKTESDKYINTNDFTDSTKRVNHFKEMNMFGIFCYSLTSVIQEKLRNEILSNTLDVIKIFTSETLNLEILQKEAITHTYGYDIDRSIPKTGLSYYNLQLRLISPADFLLNTKVIQSKVKAMNKFAIDNHPGKVKLKEMIPVDLFYKKFADKFKDDFELLESKSIQYILINSEYTAIPNAYDLNKKGKSIHYNILPDERNYILYIQDHQK